MAQFPKNFGLRSELPRQITKEEAQMVEDLGRGFNVALIVLLTGSTLLNFLLKLSLSQILSVIENL